MRVGATREAFFAERQRDHSRLEREGLVIGEHDWEQHAEEGWAAREKAAAWFDQPMPAGCALMWRAHEEPECFRTWDLYSLDDYDWVTAIPPGMDVPHFMESGSSYGCCDVAEVVLPNGWVLVVGYHS